MDRKQEILKKLREADEYISGQQLCEALGVSRTAVWKNIGKLKEEGYPIEAVTNKGYRLLSMEAGDVFNAEEVLANMNTEWAGHPLYYKEETGSTNEDIFALSEAGHEQGTVVTAVKQNAGKGRRGRVWISPPDGNVYTSILLMPHIRPDVAPMVTLVMALSAIKAMEDLREEMSVSRDECRFGIKWPNDIVASRQGGHYKKVCGILTEMRMEEMEIRDIVIGVGLNVNQEEFAPEIQETASSMKLQLGKAVNRAQLLGKMLEHFEKDYEVFESAKSLAPLKEAYEEYLVNRDRKVRILDPIAPYTGVAKGITQTGELTVIRDDNGETECVGNGEVSVRGVEGYV